MDIRILKPGKIEVSNNTARQTIELQEGIDRELAKYKGKESKKTDRSVGLESSDVPSPKKRTKS